MAAVIVRIAASSAEARRAYQAQIGLHDGTRLSIVAAL